MTFHSILFDRETAPKDAAQPDYFADLNLDQVIHAIAARGGEYDLKPFFHTPLTNTETVYYRHEVMRDMENAELMAHVKAFAEKMIIARRYLRLVEKLDYSHHKAGWFLESALVYCHAVLEFYENLTHTDLHSRGLLTFRAYLKKYAHSRAFQSMHRDAQKVKKGLANLRYCVIVQDGKFSVREYEGEADYSVDVERTFEKFKQGAVKDYLVDMPHDQRRVGKRQRRHELRASQDQL